MAEKSTTPNARPYRYMVIGAHPDDCESVGGICLKLLALGRKVKFLTATNGCSGHQTEPGAAMARRRAQEARRVSELFGVEYELLENPDGALTAGLAERAMVLRAIREWAPDFIFTHRPNDYHPDHRATSMLVQDCSYLVQVPNVCPLTPVLRYQPVIAYMPDGFQKPYPFEPTMVFDISDVFEQKIRMYHQYVSQMYEWLPWVDGRLEEVPHSEAERFEWLLKSRFGGRNNQNPRWRAALAARKGQAAADAAAQLEAFELCEYGGQATRERLDELFPF